MEAQVEPGNGQQVVQIKRWMPIVGTWEIDEDRAVFTAPKDESFKIGIALSDVRTTTARFQFTVEITDTRDGSGRLVIGHDSARGVGYSIGLGGYELAFVLNEYFLGRGSRLIRGLGRKENLKPGKAYSVDVRLEGTLVSLSVDGVQVFEHHLPHPLIGDQVGVEAYGEGRVIFSNVEVALMRPRAFVVMQYTEPFESLWKEVIEPVARKVGFQAYRAQDVFSPGVVLQDIVRGLGTSQAIIAEVTPPNPNVYYELGFAHALQTPTVLLAQKPKDGTALLPFDISGYRVIFYDDAIRGKRTVEEALEKHLRSILERPEPAPVLS
jgi:hypothetical protein